MSERLLQLHKLWIEKFDELEKGFPEANVVGPFLGSEPDRYDPSLPSVLYVGWATRGRWVDREEWQNAEELLAKIRDVRKKELNTGGGPFASLARRLSEAIAKACSSNLAEPLQNLIWTDICKVGVAKGNPPEKIYRPQFHLAVDTLRAEIEAYHPRLVMFVTGHDYDEVVQEVVCETGDASWQQHQDFCLRYANQSLPAVLWTPHPQGKRKERVAAWIEKACELIHVRGSI